MTTPSAASDMADFFDFAEAAIPDPQQGIVLDLSPFQNDESYIASSNGEFPQSTSIPDKSTEFNTDFSSWLPRYQKPAQPCAYCRSKSLECFIYNSGSDQSGCCSPCNTLFRPCSFSNPDKTAKQNNALDTLDIVTENDARNFGGLTGRKQMRSLGHMGPIENGDEGEQGTNKGAAAARFPRAATEVLKKWMAAHFDHPYPNEEEKEALMHQTGLSLSQISNWMANTRRRQKARAKRSSSPSIRPSTEAINIPVGKTWESMDPFERWKISPPENEPAPMNAIVQAVETFDPPEYVGTSNSHHKDASNNSTGSFSVFRAPSISSLETGLTNVSSGSRGSLNSAYSYGSRHSLGSMNSLRSKEKRRRRRLPPRTPNVDADNNPRLFQCTFCTDKFKSKYDWSRHEKSLHLSLEKWLCAPIGEVVADKATGKPKCVYCDEIDPSKDHLSTHNHSACFEKGPESRTFYRKDHLRQHLRLMHNCKMTTSMESWKSEAECIKSRCGFCNMRFDTWQKRIDHLAKEFRSGANMRNWKGCRGLDPHVAMHVTNAMPPYLIANESISPFPFSASNSASMKQHQVNSENSGMEYSMPDRSDLKPTEDLSAAYQEGRNPSHLGPIVLTTPVDYDKTQSANRNPDATCWEVLTLRLGKFARERIETHGPGSVTDAMLQSEARNILYGNDDPWEQTSADNPEWLDFFKKAHGIDTHAPTPTISTYYDLLEDLGINGGSSSSTTLDPGFNLANFPPPSTDASDIHAAEAFALALSQSTHPAGASHPRQPSSSTAPSPHSLPRLTSSMSTSPTSPASQTPNMNANPSGDFFGFCEPIAEMACLGPGGPCYGENGEVGFATKSFGSLQVLKKKSYWLAPSTSHLAPKHVLEDAAAAAAAVAAAASASASSSSSLPLAPVSDANGHHAVEPVPQDFECPAWDLDHSGVDWLASQSNPVCGPPASCSSTTGVDVAGALGAATTEAGSSWEEMELNFAMDMDMDMDMDLNLNF